MKKDARKASGRDLSKWELSHRGILKTYGAIMVLAGVTIALYMGNQPAHAATNPAIATVSSTPSQTMQGFGASGAWWTNDLVNFDPKVQKRVAKLLFGPHGIALSVYRYNIGGGGVGVTNPVRAPETFLIKPDVYDWHRDPGGRLFLNLAAKLGVPNLIGFANSAPTPWTTNHKNCGGNLIPGDETAYANYLTHVIRHFKKADGITFSYVSPMNEPDYTRGGCGQEGMAVPVGQRATLAKTLGKALARRVPYSHAIADESSQVQSQFNPEVPQWINTPGTAPYVAALAHHTYDFPGPAPLENARKIGERSDTPLWMTEICCWAGHGFGAQYDPTMKNALWMANAIWKNLTYANDASWQWWVALSSAIGCRPDGDPACAKRINNKGYNDGLLYYDPNYKQDSNQSIYITKRFWVMGNFSRYVRPGALRYNIENIPQGVHALAFYHTADRHSGHQSRNEGKKRWSIVAINNASASREFQVKLPGHPKKLMHAEAFETSSNKDLQRVAPPRTSSDGVLSASLPARSVTTFEVRENGPGGCFVAADLHLNTPDLLPPGRLSKVVTAKFTDKDRVPVKNVNIKLELPDGWTARSVSSTEFKKVDAGKSVTASWKIAAPANTKAGSQALKANASYRHGKFTGHIKASSIARVPPPPPTKNVYLSDLAWFYSNNDYGPIERDMSNGENAAGDGHAITINGKTYHKGLGTNAPAQIRYYLGSNCQRFISDAGVDDEVGNNGTVVFQVLAYGQKIYGNGLMTGADPAKHLDVSLNGVNALRLIVANGGDNPYSDHADWAGARVTCK